MVLPEADQPKFWLGVQGSRSTKGASRGRSKGRGRGGKNASGSRAVKTSTTTTSDDVKTEPDPNLPPHMRTTFPVIITTYEMLMKDRAYLAAYNWGFIVVDEGHRLKNMDCKLMQEIKQLTSSGRMVLTGTPLHVCPPHCPHSLSSVLRFLQNNLAELWSLLNFVLPDIFSDLYTFQEWYGSSQLSVSWRTLM